MTLRGRATRPRPYPSDRRSIYRRTSSAGYGRFAAVSAFFGYSREFRYARVQQPAGTSFLSLESISFQLGLKPASRIPRRIAASSPRVRFRRGEGIRVSRRLARVATSSSLARVSSRLFISLSQYRSSISPRGCIGCSLRNAFLHR